MIKSVALCYRNPALTHEEFRDYWENTHVPLVKRSMPGLSLYKGSFPLSDFRPGQPVSAFDCDAIVELGFPDRETMDAAFHSKEFTSPERDASSRKLLDMDRTVSMIVEEIEVDLD